MNPLDIRLQGSLQRWPEALREKYLCNLQAAGVLVPIIDKDGELSVLLTQRAADLSRHAGQICFPGGRMEEGDRDIVATALRETHEEIGIEPHRVDIAGYLDPSPTVSGYAVTPVIGFVAAGYCLRVDSREVEDTFELPLEFLLQEGNVRFDEREFDGFRIPVAEILYRERRIWGATASILIMFREKLR